MSTNKDIVQGKDGQMFAIPEDAHFARAFISAELRYKQALNERGLHSDAAMAEKLVKDALGEMARAKHEWDQQKMATGVLWC
jgi:hypothetical protein